MVYFLGSLFFCLEICQHFFFLLVSNWQEGESLESDISVSIGKYSGSLSSSYSSLKFDSLSIPCHGINSTGKKNFRCIFHLIFENNFCEDRSLQLKYRVIQILRAAADGCRLRPWLADPPPDGASYCRCSQTFALFVSHCNTGNFVNTPVHVNKTTPRH